MNTATIEAPITPTKSALDTANNVYPFTFGELFTDSTKDDGGVRLCTSAAGDGSFGVSQMPSYVKPTNLLLEGLRALGWTTKISPTEHYWSIVKRAEGYFLILPYISPRQSGALCLLDL